MMTILMGLIPIFLVGAFIAMLCTRILESFSSDEASQPEPSLPKAWDGRKPWRDISRHVPGVSEDFNILAENWTNFDLAMGDGQLLPAQDAIRRALRNDLPRIAETLELAVAHSSTPEQLREAQSRAMDSLCSLIAILNAYRDDLFESASDAQETVERYLEAKAPPTGPLALPRNDRLPPVRLDFSKAPASQPAKGDRLISW